MTVPKSPNPTCDWWCPHGAVINPVKEPHRLCVRGKDGGWMWYSSLPHPTPYTAPPPMTLKCLPQLCQPSNWGCPLSCSREVSPPPNSHYSHLSIWFVQPFHLQLGSSSHLSGFSVSLLPLTAPSDFILFPWALPILFLWMSISIRETGKIKPVVMCKRAQ